MYETKCNKSLLLAPLLGFWVPCHPAGSWGLPVGRRQRRQGHARVYFCKYLCRRRRYEWTLRDHDDSWIHTEISLILYILTPAARTFPIQSNLHWVPETKTYLIDLHCISCIQFAFLLDVWWSIHSFIYYDRPSSELCRSHCYVGPTKTGGMQSAGCSRYCGWICGRHWKHLNWKLNPKLVSVALQYVFVPCAFKNTTIT